MPNPPEFWRGLAPGAIQRDHWPTGLAEVPSLPVLAARGAHPGPAVFVTGAVHGDEYEGPAAIHALFRELDTRQLHGTLVGLPVVNLPAWQARSRTSPHDGVDLNRVFPGMRDPAAGSSRNLAQAVFDHFVAHCDLLIDLHSGGARLVHLPMVGWYAGGAGEAETLARGFGRALHPWLVPDVPGVLSYEAQRSGKLAIGAEWGGGARLDPAGRDAYVQGLRRVLAHFSGAPITPAELDTRTPIAGDYQATPTGGLFVPTVTLGERVSAGAPLGTIYDALGAPVAQPAAERAGLIAALAHLPWLMAGDRIAYIG